MSQQDAHAQEGGYGGRPTPRTRPAVLVPSPRRSSSPQGRRHDRFALNADQHSAHHAPRDSRPPEHRLQPSASTPEQKLQCAIGGCMAVFTSHHRLDSHQKRHHPDEQPGVRAAKVPKMEAATDSPPTLSAPTSLALISDVEGKVVAISDPVHTAQSSPLHPTPAYGSPPPSPGNPPTPGNHHTNTSLDTSISISLDFSLNCTDSRSLNCTDGTIPNPPTPGHITQAELAEEDSDVEFVSMTPATPAPPATSTPAAPAPLATLTLAAPASLATLSPAAPGPVATSSPGPALRGTVRGLARAASAQSTSAPAPQASGTASALTTPIRVTTAAPAPPAVATQMIPIPLEPNSARINLDPRILFADAPSTISTMYPHITSTLQQVRTAAISNNVSVTYTPVNTRQIIKEETATWSTPHGPVVYKMKTTFTAPADGPPALENTGQRFRSPVVNICYRRDTFARTKKAPPPAPEWDS